MKPTKDILQQYIDNHISQSEIAKIYNVRQPSVSLWFKSYGLISKIKTGGAYNVKDLTGQIFGKLKVVKLDNIGEYGKEYLCECECGNKIVYRGSTLTSGKIKGCGCERGKQNIGNTHNELAESRIGERFAKLKIIGYIKSDKTRDYLMVCECDCGNITKQIYADLVSNKVVSCGCYQKEQVSKTGSSIGLNNYKNNYSWYFIKNGENIKCRSGFEVIYANHLISNNVNFEYESKCFKLGDGKRYTPDFYLIDNNKYIEIKGSFKINEQYSHQKENIEIFNNNNNLSILYWNDIVKECKLPYKAYSTYLRQARKLNLKEEYYLAEKLYL